MIKTELVNEYYCQPYVSSMARFGIPIAIGRNPASSAKVWDLFSNFITEK